MLMNYYKGENTLYLRLSNSLWARGGTLIYLELFFRSFFLHLSKHRSVREIPSEQVRARTREGKATSDLTQSQNSQRKAAGSCLATLSLSQQEVESNRTLITFSSISPESQSSKASVRQRFRTMFSHAESYLCFLEFYLRCSEKEFGHVWCMFRELMGFTLVYYSLSVWACVV